MYYDREDSIPFTSLTKNKRVTARKTHNCSDCGQPIYKGTKYFRSAFIVDGEFNYTKSHSPNGECADKEREL